MRLEIQDYCIRCGLCVDLYPGLFRLDYEDDVLVVLHDEIPADLEQQARDAARDCAIAAIRIER